MRKYHTVIMRGGTSKGCMFLKKDLPENREEWDSIFLQAMGDPDPKQIDGLGGAVSSNNKIVIVWRSEEPGIDVEYLVGQVIVGKSKVDYKSNCGNMTAAVGPFAVDEGLVGVSEPITTVHLLNRNTNKKIDVTVPCENGTTALDGECEIAGVDESAPELKVNFLNPAGSKTGKLLPTGNPLDLLNIPGYGEIEVTILDVSNPMVIVRAEDVGLTGTELPDEINGNAQACELLEKIRGTAAFMMGFTDSPEHAAGNSPAVPKIGFITPPVSFDNLSGKEVAASSMDLCARVISVFKCHKACPLTSASAISVAAFMEGTLVWNMIGEPEAGKQNLRIGHPGGVMTMYPDIQISDGEITVPGVAVQRTARRIMDGTLYIRK